MATQVQAIIEKLNHIQTDLNFIKSHLTDVDLVLTDDDLDALHQAERDLKRGTTKRLA